MDVCPGPLNSWLDPIMGWKLLTPNSLVQTTSSEVFLVFPGSVVVSIVNPTRACSVASSPTGLLHTLQPSQPLNQAQTLLRSWFTASSIGTLDNDFPVGA